MVMNKQANLLTTTTLTLFTLFRSLMNQFSINGIRYGNFIKCLSIFL